MWQCVCGQVASGTFCTYCQRPAPPGIDTGDGPAFPAAGGAQQPAPYRATYQPTAREGFYGPSSTPAGEAKPVKGFKGIGPRKKKRKRPSIALLAFLVVLLGGGAGYWFNLRPTTTKKQPRLDLIALSAKPAGLAPVTDTRVNDRIGPLTLAEAAKIDGVPESTLRQAGFVAGYASWFGKLPGEVLIVDLREHTTPTGAELSVRPAARPSPAPRKKVAGTGTAQLFVEPPTTQGAAWVSTIEFARGRVSARMQLLTRVAPTDAQLRRLETTAQAQYAKLPG